MPAQTAIIGRTAELSRIDALLDEMTGGGTAMVIRGEAGIGKTTLVAHTRARWRAAGRLVLEATGQQAEATLPFAGLHQLLAPVLTHATALEAPRRDALHAAFGLSRTTTPDRFLIALATLDLLGAVALQRPLLVVLEDVQWIDAPSREALAFVARRLDNDPIVLLATQRDGLGDAFLADDAEELKLAPLPGGDAELLLDAHEVRLSATERAEILSVAAGNPLALVELPALRAGADADLPLNTRLVRAFGERFDDLPEETSRLLLLAALDEEGSVSDVLRAAGEPTSPDDLLPGVDAGLAVIEDGRLRFRHPLMRSAVRVRALPSERLAAHRALAGALVDEPARAVWHRAAASIGRDESVAAALEDAAVAARRQGALDVAITAYERAGALSERPHDDARRRLAAAELAVELGRVPVARRLLSSVSTGGLDPVGRGRMRLLRETVTPGRSDEGTITSLAATAARMRREGELHLATALLMLAASRCLWADVSDATRGAILAVVDDLELDEPRRLAVLAYLAPPQRGAEVLERLAAWQATDAADADAIVALGTAASVAGALPDAARILGTAAAELRAQGRIGHLPRVLALHAWALVHSGGPDLALEAADEACRLSHELGDVVWMAGGQAVAAFCHAVRGDFDQAERIAADAESKVLPLGVTFLLANIQLGRGLASLGAGRHDEAYARLARAFDAADPAGHSRMATAGLGDLAEAAVQCDAREPALELFERLTGAGMPASPWMQVGLRHAAAVLADDAHAERAFHTAIDHPDLARWPFIRARVHLAFGMWLRRHRRAVDSRVHLRTARDAFDALRAEPWSARAREELRASGETSRRREPAAWAELTPQELQIARLAAQGLTNREIGQRLFLSHRTVSTHLHRSFPKLGVTSRGELGQVLATLGQGVVPG